MLGHLSLVLLPKAPLELAMQELIYLFLILLHFQESNSVRQLLIILIFISHRTELLAVSSSEQNSEQKQT